jgi:predicted deacylase
MVRVVQVGEIEDIQTVAYLVLDLHSDAEGYVVARIAQAETDQDLPALRKWLRVLEAVRAMPSEQVQTIGRRAR